MSEKHVLALILPQGVKPEPWHLALTKAGQDMRLLMDAGALRRAVANPDVKAIAAPAWLRGRSVLDLVQKACLEEKRNFLPTMFFLHPDEDPPNLRPDGMTLLRYLPEPFHPYDCINTLRLYEEERKLVQQVSESRHSANLRILKDQRVADIARELISEGYSGLLTCLSRDLFGHIVFTHGKIVDAVSHYLHGVDALERMLPWNSGVFLLQRDATYRTVTPLDATFSEEEFFVETIRQQDYLEHSLGEGDFEHTTVEPSVSEETLKDIILATLGPAYVNLILLTTGLVEILRYSHLSDAEVLTRIIELRERGVIELGEVGGLDSQAVSVQMPLSLAIDQMFSEDDPLEDPSEELVGVQDLRPLDIDLPAVKEKLSSAVEFLSTVVLDADKNALDSGLESQISVLGIYMRQILEMVGPFTCKWNPNRPEQLKVTFGTENISIKHPPALRLFQRLGMTELRFEQAETDEVGRFCRALSDHASNASQLVYKGFTEANNIASIFVNGNTKYAEAPTEAEQAESAPNETAEHDGDDLPYLRDSPQPDVRIMDDEPVFSEAVDENIEVEALDDVKDWGDIEGILNQPLVLREAIWDFPIKVARSLIRHAEAQDFHQQRGFSLIQLWHIVKGMQDIEHSLSSITTMTPDDRFQTLHMVTDVFDQPTLGAVIGLGVEHFGWRSFAKTLVERMEDQDIQVVLASWYLRLVALFQKRSRVGKIIIHERMVLHLGVLMSCRPGFDQTLAQMSRNRHDLGLEPVDLALIGGKTPADMKLSKNARRLICYPFNHYNSEGQLASVRPVFGQLVEKPDSLDFQAMLYLFICLAKHPDASTRETATLLLIDICELATTTGDQKLFGNVLHVITTRLTSEKEEHVLDAAVEKLQALVEHVKHKKSDDLAERVSKSLVAVLESNKKLNKEQRMSLVQSTGSLDISSVIDQLIEDINDPDRWDLATSFLVDHPDKVRKPLLDKLFSANVPASVQNRALNFLERIGIAYNGALLKWTDDPNERTRLHLANILGICADPATREALQMLAADKSPEVRIAALKALAKTMRIASEAFLLERFHQDDDPRVRSRILSMLQEVGTGNVVKELVPYLERKLFGGKNLPDNLQQEICYLLGQVGAEEAVPHLLTIIKSKGLRGPNIPLQAAAVQALAKFPTVENKRLLNRLHKDSPEHQIKVAAGRALTEIKANAGQIRKPRTATLDSDDEQQS